MSIPATWSERYQQERELVTDRILFRPFEWHDDKPDGRPDLHITTQPGDLDCAGRPLEAGR